MNQLGLRGQLLARIFISLVFLLNALGIIDQTVPAHEMIERGLPQSLVPFAIISGRALQLTAGLALILGVLPRLAAAALFLFLVPATLISHSFWLSAGTPAFVGQLINFFKNVAILGGLLFIVSTARQPSLVRLRHAYWGNRGRN
jgi:putative oxidoreductase